jgi:acylphosphatase
MVLSTEKEVEVTIAGKVQGVNFRRFAKNRANELELMGYVLNSPDGTVEAIAQGEHEQLEQFVVHLRKGPHFAEIEDIDVVWHNTRQDTFTSFEIRETI